MYYLFRDSIYETPVRTNTVYDFSPDAGAGDPIEPTGLRVFPDIWSLLVTSQYHKYKNE